MGSPLAPLFSDVCMNWLIDQSQKIATQPVQLYRYVDGCFAAFEERAQLPNFTNILTLFTQTYNLPMNWPRTTNWLFCMYGLAIKMEN